MAVTQDKINALLKELRSWDFGELKGTLSELSRKFDLESSVVDRVARSEGWVLLPGFAGADDEQAVDPNATTIDLDPEAVREAAELPDPDPDWTFKDKDSGAWVRNADGEYELLDSNSDPEGTP